DVTVRCDARKRVGGRVRADEGTLLSYGHRSRQIRRCFHGTYSRLRQLRQDLSGSERNDVSLTRRGCMHVEKIAVWRPIYKRRCNSSILLSCGRAPGADTYGIATL